MEIRDMMVGQGLLVAGERLVRIPEEEFWVACKRRILQGTVPFAGKINSEGTMDLYLIPGNREVGVVREDGD